MELRNRIRVILLVVAVIGSALTVGYLMTTPQPAPQPEEGKTYPTVRHLPISIGDASDFTPPDSAAGCACVVAGSGTSGDPYVVAGWEIDASETNGISAAGVDEYFTITQVRISGTQLHTAISLQQVQNGRISSSVIIGTFVAISLLSSSKVTIINNTISKSDIGVSLEASNFNTVVDNRMDEIAQISIFVRGSDNLVEHNLINRTFGGVNIDGTPGPADRNTVKNNTIRRTEGYGIALWQARDNTIAGNVITEGGSDGVLLTDSSSYNTIENNNVTQNTANGIMISAGCSNNLVQRNVSTGNGDGIKWFDLHSEDSNNVWSENTSGTRSPDTLG